MSPELGPSNSFVLPVSFQPSLDPYSRRPARCHIHLSWLSSAARLHCHSAEDGWPSRLGNGRGPNNGYSKFCHERLESDCVREQKASDRKIQTWEGKREKQNAAERSKQRADKESKWTCLSSSNNFYKCKKLWLKPQTSPLAWHGAGPLIFVAI